MTYWILRDNNTVIARSLVRPVEGYEINKRCNINDSHSNDIEGSDQTAPTLDLLSEMVNIPPPEIDITEINGLISKDHIGFEFIKNDVRNVPIKSKVIEVDKETGKLMIEYVHG